MLTPAIQDYTTAIDLIPDFFQAYNNRGDAYRQTGEFDAAIQDLNTAIDLKPDLVNAYNNRGVAYALKGDIGAAIQDYTTAIKVNPQDANGYLNRTMIWLPLRAWEKAKAELMTAKNNGVDIAAGHSIETMEVLKS